MIKDDGEVIHFNNPKVQASLSSNTFAVTGQAEVKSKQFTWNISTLFYYFMVSVVIYVYH